MSDRSTFEVVFDRTRAEEVAAILRVQVADLDEADGYRGSYRGKALSYSHDDMDYGGLMECEEMAGAGVTFFGWHGVGIEYPAMRFCGLDGKYFEAQEAATESGLMVRLNEEDGNAEERDLENAREFLEAERRAMAALESK